MTLKATAAERCEVATGSKQSCSSNTKLKTKSRRIGTVSIRHGPPLVRSAIGRIANQTALEPFPLKCEPS